MNVDAQQDGRRDVWENPLASRYASAEMARLWSDRNRYRTWRQVWLALAEAEAELGLSITPAQLSQLRANLEPIDFVKAAAYEKQMRHDVFAHLHTYGDAAPLARPILHLGATSAFVTDNTDLMLMRDSLDLIAARIAGVIEALSAKAAETKDIVCLGLTHLQPAQPTTIGKRICLWIHDLLIDLEEIVHRRQLLRARGAKGTTGTQASFLELFDGDHARVRALDEVVSRKLGFNASYDVTGQTYTRKIDYFVMTALSGIAQSAYKLAGDIRLLANLREIEEPFGKKQVGSSAMAYKRNPMRSERVCSLARYVISLPANAANTHAAQWFERTLDDSAIRRLVLPEGFLAVDVILSLLNDICSGIQVWPNVIARRVAAELPFMATENIMMEAVKAGGDRQELHEAIRTHSMEAARKIKEEGKENDLLERLKTDPLFASVAARMDELVNPRAFVGRAPEQCGEFLQNKVYPILKQHAGELNKSQSDSVSV